jgi:microcystin-dependent protein
MANYEATRYDFDGSDLTGIQGVNTGLIIPWGDSTPPSGFLECNGSAISRATYAALFAVVGTTYGAGNGSTTFNIPDLQDKTVLSRSNNKALASTMGANTVTKTGNIGGSAAATTLQTAQIPSHSHSNALGATGGGGAGMDMAGPHPVTGTVNSGSAGQDQSHTHNLSANYTGDATSVLQPYLTLIYIIKT